MDRLTTNKPVNEMETYELAHNCMFVKDGEAWFRDFQNEVSLRNMIRGIMKKHTDYDEQLEDDEILDEVLLENLQFPPDGDIDGLIAVFNMIAWANADLRERLKHYEDLEEEGKLIVSLCKQGDIVYEIDKSIFDDDEIKPIFCKILYVMKTEFNIFYGIKVVDGHGKGGTYQFTNDDFGKSVFLTEQEAKEALEGMKE